MEVGTRCSVRFGWLLWLAAIISFLSAGPRAALAQTGGTTGTTSEVSLRGEVQSINEADLSFVVSGMTVLTDSETQFVRESGAPAEFSDLQEGTLVIVYVGLTNEGDKTPALRVIIVADPIPFSGEGVIQEMGPTIATFSGWMRLNDLEITIAAGAEIVDAEDNPISPSEITVGEYVRVEGFMYSRDEPTGTDNTNSIPYPERVAKFIKVYGEEPPARELEGTISQLDSSGCFQMNDIRSPLTVMVDICTNNETEIVTSQGDPLEFSDLENGDDVIVLAHREDNSSVIWIADKIIVKQQAIVEGHVISINPLPGMDAGTILIEETLLQISERTEIIDENGLPILLREIEVGDLVRAEVGFHVMAGDGSLPFAKSLQRLIDTNRREYHGVIQEFKSDTCFRILDGNFETEVYADICTNNDTEIVTNAGEPLQFSDLQIGDEVSLVANRFDDNPISVWIAERIVVTRQAQEPIIIEGRVENVDALPGMDAGAILVDGQLIQVTANTAITDRNGVPILLRELGVGDLVRVEALTLSSYTDEVVLRAISVQRLIDFDRREYSGTIQEFLSDTCFRILDGNFEGDVYADICTDDNTQIVTAFENLPLEFSDLQVGDQVYVVANRDDTNPVSVWIAERIVVDRQPQDPIVVEGPIQDIRPLLGPYFEGVIVVDGLEFFVDPNAELLNNAGDPIRFGDFSIGDVVRAIGKYIPRASGSDEVILITLSIQQLEESPETWKGYITAILPTELDAYLGILVVSNRRVFVAADATIIDQDGNPLPYDQLALRDYVEVQGEFLPGILTNTIEPLPDMIGRTIQRLDPPSQEQEFRGRIVAIDDNAGCFDLAVGNGGADALVSICTNSETEITNEANEPLTFADLNIDDRVFVEAVRAPDSTSSWSAISILLLNEDPEITVQGRIKEILPSPTGAGLGIVKVREALFIVSPETEILDPSGNPLVFEDLAVGQLVLATGIRTSSTDLVEATSIKVLEDPHPEIVDFHGLVESVNLDLSQLVVRGILVRVGDITQILDVDGNLIGLPKVPEGSNVHVHGVRLDNGSVLAHVIQLLDGPPPGQIEIVGRIAEMNPENKTLVVAGHLVFVSEDTVVLDIENNIISYDDLSVGLVVEVEGYLLATFAPTPYPALAATKVEVEYVGHLEFHVSGLIGAIGEEGVWSVAGQRFRVTRETQYANVEGEVLTADDFAPGDFVHVHGDAIPGELPIAREIILDPYLDGPPCDVNVRFAGPVEAVDTEASTLVVDGRFVEVTNNTRISREGVGPIPLSEITTDDVAMVGAVGGTEAAASLVACYIVVHEGVAPPPNQDHRVVGLIESIAPRTMTLVVRERTIQVTEETKIFTRRDEPLSFEDLEVGQLVDARGRLDADGVLVAALIRIQEENDDPRPIRPFGGLITTLNLPDTMTVDERVVNLTDETIYKGLDDQPIDPSVLLVGDAVVIVPLLDSTTDPTLVTLPEVTAKVVKLRAAILEKIDAELSHIYVAGGPALVDENTVIRELRGDALTFEDLSVGDLIFVRYSDIEIYPPLATHIVRVEVPEISGPVGDFGKVIPGTIAGNPTMTSTDPLNCFGYISLPTTMVLAEPDTIYDIRMKVSTNVEDPVQVPVARIRANMSNFEKGANLVVTSAGSFSQVPTTDGREYKLLFVPSADLNVESEVDAAFFTSLDLLSFEGRFQAGASLQLDSVQVLPVPTDQINVAATLVHDEFISGSDGWVSSGAEDVFSLPRYGAEGGALTLAAVDENTFGFWTKNTGVVAQPGKAYRARFLVYTNAENPADVPTFRVRLNTSAFELASVVNVDARATLSETLRTEPRAYDVYLPVPADVSGTESLIASIDILAFGGNADPDATVTLEQFFLEEITLDE